MRYICAAVLFLQGWLFALQTDFDVAVVGTSPISMLEAIYHLYCNKRVLVLEADPQCGGAWKSIDVCGVPHVDLGCHLIGADTVLQEFFENYFGCTFVCLEHFTEKAAGSHLHCRNGYYFSGGCHELISKMEATIRACSHGTLMQQKLESIYIDQVRQCIELSLGDVRYTTAKLIITPASSFRIENPLIGHKESPGHDYHHVYMLVEDGAPVKFTYLSQILKGMSRAMNLTPFVKIPHTGQQLIVVQTQKKGEEADPLKFLEAFKSKGLLSREAKILATDHYIYRQSRSNFDALLKLAGSMIELFDMSTFSVMKRHVEKWKGALQGREEGMDGFSSVSLMRVSASKEMKR
jgi:hypothetical protein